MRLSIPGAEKELLGGVIGNAKLALRTISCGSGDFRQTLGTWHTAEDRGRRTMSLVEWRLIVAKLLMTTALACGIVGLLIGIDERTWKLGITGWFTGGILLAVLAITVLIDEYFEAKRAGR